MLAKPAMLAIGLIGLMIGPALAVPFCTETGSGVVVSFGFGIGGKYTESERNAFDLMRLRRAGVDANATERWGGCIRAFVRKPGGGETMEFYHPDTLTQVF